MTTVLVDSSVIVKWFHHEGETEVVEARAIRDANQRGDIEARITDLCLYEVGNILLVRLRWPATAVADQLDDLVAICGIPLVTAQAWLRDATTLAATHHLTFYDAAWAAAARGLDVPLVSADRKLLRAGLAHSPAAAVSLLSLQ